MCSAQDGVFPRSVWEKPQLQSSLRQDWVPILPSWKITCLPASIDSAIPTQQDSIFSIDQGLLWVYPSLTLHIVHIEHPKFGVIGH